MAGFANLQIAASVPIMETVDDAEATQLMLETLFEIRWRVRDIHYAVAEDDDGEEEEEENS